MVVCVEESVADDVATEPLLTDDGRGLDIGARTGDLPRMFRNIHIRYVSLSPDQH